MSYINLNIKSGYSFFASTLKVKDIVDYAIKNDIKALALTDCSNMFGMMEFYKLCTSNNIQPIIGMEINFLEGDGRSYPIILIAKNIEGYKTLCSLTSIVSKGNLDIILDKEELIKFNKEVIAILPTSRSYLKELLSNNYFSYLDFFKKNFASFYLGLERYSPNDDDILSSLRLVSKEMNIETCVIQSIQYEQKDDVKYLKLLKAIENNTQVSKLEVEIGEEYYFKSEEELSKYFTKEELDNTYKIALDSKFNLLDLRGELVTYPVPNGVNQKDYLYALCYKGLEKRLNRKISKNYLDRLNYELDIITKMGYTNYFLVVWDYVKFAKNNGILVGPGRGSAAGSLVSYVLGITNVDPIKYELLFERFLNPERISMPDIDIDFIDSRRDEIIEYLSKKYGLDRCAHVIAFQTFGARQAFRDTFKAMGLSLVEVNALSNKMPKEWNANLSQLLDKSPSFKALMKSRANYMEMLTYASKIEGLPRQTTLHAAGMVISNEKLSLTTPVYMPSNDVSSTQYDMNHIEDMGLLKMDILGLKNLRIIDSILNKIKQIYGKVVDLNSINLEDEAVYKMISSLHTSGIFQLESAGMKRAINTLKPSSFNDIVAILALFRPGPMAFIDVYAKRKNGLEKVSYVDPCLEDILKPTYGILIYQEQIMQVLVKMAGFSLGQADVVRRAISKKVESKLIEIEKDFIEGCLKNNHTKEAAKRVFDLIVKFANYGFNKAHSVSYAFVSYQMAYLKYYYPEIFFSEVLNTFASNNEVKFGDYIQEINSSGIKLLPPSINKSSSTFIVEDGNIRYSLRSIKGVTPTLANEILLEKEKGEFKDFPSFIARMKRHDLNDVQTLALIQSGALDEFGFNRETLKANINNHFIYADIVSSDIEGQLSLNYEDNPPPEMIIKERNSQQELEDEYEILGAFLSGFPLIYERERIKEKGFKTITEVKDLEEKVKLVVYISSYRTIKTKNGDYMTNIRAMDETGEITITVFPQEYLQYEGIIRKGNYVQVLGEMQQRNMPSVVVKQMKIFRIKESE